MMWPHESWATTYHCGAFPDDARGQDAPPQDFFVNDLLIKRDYRPPASITGIIDTVMCRFIGGKVLQAPALQVGLQRLQDHVVDAHHRLGLRRVLVGGRP